MVPVEYFVVGVAALFTSALTLFSGFGLGTLLMPAFAVFFPVNAAVALTAVVHFLNNLFKLSLLGRKANGTVVLRFGVPALLASFGGAALLVWMSELPALARYTLLGRSFRVHPVELVIGILMAGFAILEVVPAFQRLSFRREHLVAGGVLSGFFGGLSGHQGALRSAFLVKAGLNTESFIATNVVIACLVDVARLLVYGGSFHALGLDENVPLLATATLCAFLGAFIGTRLMKKVTMKTVQWLVTALLLAIAVLLASGLLSSGPAGESGP
jgi:uncharacterized membrane protein YfcA